MTEAVLADPIQKPAVDPLVCEVCGAGPFKAKVGLRGHENKHVAEAKRAEKEAEKQKAALPPPGYTPSPAAPEGEPAFIDDWLPVEMPEIGQRMIKMLQPRCDICQSVRNRRWNWWETCRHDPYVTVREHVEAVPQYEDLGGGRRRQIGVEEILTYVARPNVTQVALSMKVNSGTGVDRHRRRGDIFPSEVRSPHFPFGIAEACQFRECFEQHGLVDYTTGTFCREREAALVLHAESRSGYAMQVAFDERSSELREEQLADWGRKTRL